MFKDIYSCFFLFSLTVILTYCSKKNESILLEKGLVITQSVTIKPGVYEIDGTDSLDQGVITIKGNDITIDFNGAVLRGSNDAEYPNTFFGLGVRIDSASSNITIKNLTVRGFKVGLMAVGVDSLSIQDSDFSYNFRQQLKSIREREDLSDWLSYHNNEADEWLRYGAGIYLKNCDFAIVRNTQATGGQNGLMLTRCNNGLFYNNRIQFNSGIGIGLYRSSDNRIMHNKLDWNVRGYSHGFYQRGQDSAGILCYEQSSRNIFAYNSATHSGDGFFLWAGQHTMDTGEGGCNENIIYKNDFSHAPTNGVEVTFSSNTIAYNRLEECRYGVWAGYSHHTLIHHNEIRNNEFGVAFEHGNSNRIESNLFAENEIGIQLWERKTQPADWGFSRHRDVSSRDYQILNNQFTQTKTPLKIKLSREVMIRENDFHGFDKLLLEEEANENLMLKNNSIYGAMAGYLAANNSIKDTSEFKIKSLLEFDEKDGITPLEDGIDAMLPENHLRGRQYILVNEWGPYDFRYPVIWLREIQEDGTYVFLLLGPQGNWKAVNGKGFDSVNPKSGSFPATLKAKRNHEAEELNLQLEFIGERITTQFGETIKKGKVVPFEFERYEKELNWEVTWYNYGSQNKPLENYEAFRQLKNAIPVGAATTKDLAFAWWDSPAKGVHPDRFATFASTQFESRPGRYKIMLTSDDGVKMYLDGKLLIDHWDIHVPATDEVEIELGGKHILEIEHFEGGGFSTLSFRMEKLNHE